MSSTGEQEKTVFTPLGKILPLEKKLKEKSFFKPRKVIFIAGPTACGKTDLSLLLADMLRGEIVSADSCQVYRGMDIGTAKVSREERIHTPHYLVDIRHVQEPFNVVDFYYEASQAMESILARDRVPIIVGGTGLYQRALIYGPPQGPPSVPELRDELEERWQEFGAQPLLDELMRHDPVYGKTITAHDKNKIIRGLEIISLTGKKVSDFSWSHDRPRAEYDFHCWFIHRPRELLYPIINQRCEQMVETGLIDEVKQLKEQGILQNKSAASAIGYRQWLNFIAGDVSFNDAMDSFKKDSRRLAKRQFTWFRKEPLFHWLDVALHDQEIAAEMIAREYMNH